MRFVSLVVIALAGVAQVGAPAAEPGLAGRSTGTVSGAGAQSNLDIRGCADALEKLRMATAEAVEVAKAASEADAQVETAAGSARRTCDIWGSGAAPCEKDLSQYKKAMAEADAKVLEFRAKYISVEARTSGVQLACESVGKPAVAIPGVSDPHRRACLVFMSQRDAAPDIATKLNADCRAQGLSEDECRICLAVNSRAK
jgi:hypothetical protein